MAIIMATQLTLITMTIQKYLTTLMSFLITLTLAACGTTTHSLPVADESDPFLWLEEITSERSLNWVKTENSRSQKVFEASPVYEEMQREAKAILTSSARIPIGSIRGDYVFNFWKDENHVRGVLRRATLSSYISNPDWEVLLDIDALAEAEGKNWVFSTYNCLPPEYEHCMIGLSPGGTDAAEYREFSVSQKAFVSDGFYLPAAKSSVFWKDKDTLFVGTSWDDKVTDSGYAKSTRLLKRGQMLGDASPVFDGKQQDVGAFVTGVRDGATTYPLTRRAMTFFDSEYYGLHEDGTQRKLPLPTKISIHGNLNEELFVTLKQDWVYQGNQYLQGSLITLDLNQDTVKNVFTPSSSQSIDDVAISESAVYISLLDDVQGQLLKLIQTEYNWTQSLIDLPENGVVSISSTSASKNQLLVSFESMTVPKSLYFVDEQDNLTLIQSLPEFYDASDVVVEQRFTQSSDGTRIPYFIMAKKSVLEKGNAPTIQYGYGGFNIPILPIYYTDEARPQHGALAGKLWISRGGILVLSNIRGGGEYGPRWHRSVQVENRQLSFDDFFAVSEALIADGVTSPEKLGAIGRSNGGLLMGVALTQRPDLYQAIDCGVPLSDMLRYHKLLAGASWTAEYGNPDIPAERSVLKKYSPYQKLTEEADYPNVFFYTSTKDDRVHPGHARKMAARLQQFGKPFLYYENIDGGHGGAANQDQLAYRNALEYIYFYEELF